MNLKTLIVAGALMIAVGNVQAAETSAKYEIMFQGQWTAASHPLDYPSNAHFSGLVGATHNGAYRLFGVGGSATEGLERLAEMGAHSPLDREIRQAISEGKAGQLFETGALFGAPWTSKAEFTADTRNNMVSFAAMIAPSPDWFTGAADVALVENGDWIKEKTLVLYAYDAGTDDGTTYQAADIDAKGKVTMNAAPHFNKDGKAIPVATVVIRRLAQ
jgi:hypothetical protein